MVRKKKKNRDYRLFVLNEKKKSDFLIIRHVAQRSKKKIVSILPGFPRNF